jgi:hypothetical protein
MQQFDLNSSTDSNFAITPSRAGSISQQQVPHHRAAASTWGESGSSIDACTSPTKPSTIVNSNNSNDVQVTSPSTPVNMAKQHLLNENPYLREEERREKNKRSVLRLISNNTTALTLFIPQWDHSNDFDDPFHDSSEPLSTCKMEQQNIFNVHEDVGNLNGPGGSSSSGDFWELDETIGRSPGMASRWKMIKAKFRRTLKAIQALDKMYSVPAFKQTLVGHTSTTDGDEMMDTTTSSSGNHSHHHHNFDPRTSTSALMAMVNESDEPVIPPEIVKHAIVLSHIAARRTDDPKVGVGKKP